MPNHVVNKAGLLISVNNAYKLKEDVYCLNTNYKKNDIVEVQSIYYSNNYTMAKIVSIDHRNFSMSVDINDLERA